MDQGVKMSPRAFVILPTRDLEGSRKFFSHLGFEFDPNFSGEQSACVIFSDGASAMLMPEEMVKSFTSKQLGDATTTAQAIVALLAQRASSALEAGLAALSYASGPTVGAFLLGVSSRRATAAGTLVGMLAGLVTPTLVGLLTPLAWTWLGPGMSRLGP